MREWIGFIVAALEVAGAVVIVGGTAVAMTRAGYLVARRRVEDGTYRQIRIDVGRAILLGLELLVAADIVKTVGLELSFSSVAVLGLVVLIRTFLSFTLEVEMTGRWPWQGRGERD
ncbi:MAG: DUF1622 domain-containing protein [Planctomycetaceae bacterium]|nr:DUF1622 domain-containing protein [Planctomycetaceae bacterium]